MNKMYVVYDNTGMPFVRYSRQRLPLELPQFRRQVNNILVCIVNTLTDDNVVRNGFAKNIKYIIHVLIYWQETTRPGAKQPISKQTIQAASANWG